MKFRIILVATLLLISTAVFAAEQSVPRVLAYQSVMYDEGGNPIADGESEVIFRIVDYDGNVLYDEQQRLDVVRGAVSALVGNGLTAEGAPTGGLPFDVLGGGDGRYLEVEVMGYPPTDPMEIASVPYAIYADRALGVADGAVDAAGIADGSIAFEDLSDEVVDRIAKQMTGEREIVFKDDLDSMYREPEAASKIGVERGFSYSGANDLQGVLEDMDRAVKGREEKIVTETETRIKAINGIQGNIDNESFARQQADVNEAAARQAADAGLQTAIDTEAANRSSADSAHSSATGAVHGLAASEAIVGTDKAQTLSNKILVSPTAVGGMAIQDGLVVTGNVDGVDVSEHDHSGGAMGKALFPDTIWFDAGKSTGSGTVDLPAGYTMSNCRVATAVALATEVGKTLYGIDASLDESEGTDTTFTVKCTANGGSGNCQVSYTVICIKGM